MRLAQARILIGLAVLFTGAGLPLRAQNSPQGEADFLSNTRQLTYEGRRSGEGYFSPDGKKLIFQSERERGNPFYQIYILDLETGDSHRVSPGLGKTTCAFFRPGTDEVLFGSTHHDPEAAAKQEAELEFRASGQTRRYSWDYDEQMEIYTARRDGTDPRRLTQSRGYDAEAAYSPDGRKIVFTSLRQAYPPEQLLPEDRERLESNPSYFGEIYIMNADGSNQRRLTFNKGYDGGPFFSPDGERIIWRRFDASGTADIFTMTTDGTDVRRLTDFGCVSWSPYYHPSGDYAIFTANKEGFGNFELYLVDLAGAREPVRVTYTAGFDGLPVFSPDGNRLCWTSNRGADGTSQLFLADWNHEAALAALEGAPPRSPASQAAPTALNPEISADDLRVHVEYLASDELEGRLTGTAGAELAAEYIAEQLRRGGIEAFGEGETFFQPFEFSAGVRVVPEENHLSVGTEGDSAPVTFELEEDFRPLSFTANDAVEGEVVFAGYGLFVPGKPGEGYDSYAGLDVTNKVVLALRYVPEDVEPQRRQELNRYAGLRYKAMMARERGAKAILFVTGPNSPNPGALAPLSFDSSLAGSGIVAASVSDSVAEALLAAAGKELESAQTALDSENPHVEGSFAIPNARVKIRTGVERIRQTDRNVLGLLPPGDGRGSAEYVIIGAHYDHLGYGESGSREHQHERGEIHNGADDNASGVAAVLELAAALAAERGRNPDRFQRGIIFALWSGEELGLIGSSHFADNPVVSLSNVAAYLNFDMIGRLRDNKLVLQGIGSSTDWRRLIERRNVAAGFNLTLQENPYLPTDVTAFYPKGVPVLSFFTGSHEDYHRPTDTADKINYDGLERITRLAKNLIHDLIGSETRLAYAEVERVHAPGMREGLRAYLGTIPDYATDISGVKISGVQGGSPAAKAGLKSGDIIVQLGGQKIANIYDYTFALDAVKIGEPAKMVVLRDGEEIVVTITPAARGRSGP